MSDPVANCRAQADEYDKAAYRVAHAGTAMRLRLRAAQMRTEADRLERGGKREPGQCRCCNSTGKLSNKIGGKWVHYPQIPCGCTTAL